MLISSKSKKNIYKKSKNFKSVKKIYKYINKTKGGGNNNINLSNTNTNIPCDLLTDEQKYILHLYFGVSTTILSNNITKNNKLNTKNNKLNTKNLYFGKQLNGQKIINSSRKIKYIKKIKCFLEGCNNDIQIYELSDNDKKYLILYFPTGKANRTNYNTDIISLIGIENIESLKILLTYILVHLQSNEYHKIILSGHSNGMSSAIMFAYILYICTLDDLIGLPEHQDVEYFLEILFLKNINDNEKKQNAKTINLIKNIKNQTENIKDKIYICGTAGFPILWKIREDFDLFNDFYKNKYIHIISGKLKNNKQTYDDYAYYNLYNDELRQIEALYSGMKQEEMNEAKFKIKQKIPSTYYNFGSIIFNIDMSTEKVSCFYLDSILPKINEIFSIKNSGIHDFTFYRYLYNKYFDRKTKNNINYNY